MSYKRLMSIGAACVLSGGVLWALAARPDRAFTSAPQSAAPTDVDDERPLTAPMTLTKITNASVSESEILTLRGTGTPSLIVKLIYNGRTYTVSDVDSAGVWSVNISLDEALPQSLADLQNSLDMQELPANDALAPQSQLRVFDIVTEQNGEPALISSSTLMLVRREDTGQLAALLCSPGGATDVLLSPFSGGAPQVSGLSFTSGDYDNAGGVIFSGLSTVDGRIRIQANRSMIGETGLDQNGHWVMIAGSTLPYGGYSLSVMRIKSDGSIDAQMVLPFARKDPMEAGPNSPDTLVQFDDDHWHISRKLLGGGSQHSVIYSALALIP